ncbi:NfeD family protein [Patulibacter defluvii]|uniref:NfeD family protein n=1 Tax=Patulibacter defluvii TaxID=3095358 RepID=UPI002A75A8CC|nr:NfeD family protein [Patulibacter sp. DM4]
MEDWIVWLLIAVGFGVAEALTLSLFLAPFAAGAAGATIVAGAGGDLAPQVVVFAVVTAVCMLLFRPIARRHLRQPSTTRTGTAALIGRTALVLQPLTGPEGAGQIRLEGEVWTARTEDGAEIPAGHTVTVLEIRGATAIVTD